MVTSPSINTQIELAFDQIPSIGDLGLVYTKDPVTHETIVDFSLTPGRDAVIIHGVERFIQDVTRWLTTPQGSNPFMPTWGNPNYHDVLGVPGSLDVETKVLSAIRACETYFKTRQRQQRLSGTIFSGEEFISFDDIKVHSDGVTVECSFSIRFRVGKSAAATVKF